MGLLKIGFLNTKNRGMIQKFLEKRCHLIPNKPTNIKTEAFDNFYNSDFFKNYIKKQIKIYEHPILFETKKIEDIVIVKIWNLTHSDNMININKDKVDKILVGKDGNGKLQYLTKASCILEMTIQEYNDMFIDVTDNKDKIENLLGQKDLKDIENQIDPNWEEYSYSNYLNKSIQPQFNKWLKEEQKNEYKELIEYKKEEE